MALEQQISDILRLIYQEISTPQHIKAHNTDQCGNKDPLCEGCSDKNECEDVAAILDTAYNKFMPAFQDFRKIGLKGFNERTTGSLRYLYPIFETVSPIFPDDQKLLELEKVLDRLYFSIWSPQQGVLNFPTVESIEEEFQRDKDGFFNFKQNGSAGFQRYKELLSSKLCQKEDYQQLTAVVNVFNSKILAKFYHPQLQPEEIHLVVPGEELFEHLPLLNENKFILRPDNAFRVVSKSYFLQFKAEGVSYTVKINSGFSKITISPEICVLQKESAQWEQKPLSLDSVAPDSYLVKVLAAFESE